MIFDKNAGAKQWGFGPASRARFIAGGDTGVLVCHGFGGSPANMRCLADAAAELGCTVSVPLLSGHASTLADMEKCTYADWQADVEAAYRSLVDAGCGRIVLCGLSMGALLMADLAARRQGEGRIAGLYLVCPPLKMRGYLNFSSHLGKIAPYVLTRERFRPDPDMEMYYGMASSKLRDLRALAAAVRREASSISVPVELVEAGRDNRVHPSTYKLLEAELGLSGHTVFPEAPHGIPYSDQRDELAAGFASFLRARMQ